jgi:hypothetical protein
MGIDPHNFRTWHRVVVSYENKNRLINWLHDRDCYMSGTFPPMRFNWEWIEGVTIPPAHPTAQFWIMDSELAMLAKLTFA